MTISELLLPEFDSEMANTRKILAIVPEDNWTWQPHAKSMTLGRLAGHVAEMPNWAKHTFETERLELPKGMKGFEATSRQELLDRFDAEVPVARGFLARATDEEFAKTWTLVYDGKVIFSMPRTGVIRATVLNHMIHHRAQLGVYLRMLEVEIPGMYGPSADEMKYWAAQTA